MNVTSVPASYLGPGQTWSIHVTPTDENLLAGATVVSSTTILNTEPTAEITVKTDPIWLGERVDLSASLSTDIDGQIVSALWSWTDTDSMTGSASGTEISIFPTANTVVTLMVVDDMGEFAVVESVKSASPIFAPLSGEITEVNEELEDTPELMNTSPYGDGWIIKMTINNPDQLANLMDAAAYRAEIGE